MTSSNFNKILKEIGANRYNQVNSKLLVLYVSNSSGNARKDMLKALAERLQDYKAQYNKSTSVSSAGHIDIPGTKSKIAVKPDILKYSQIVQKKCLLMFLLSFIRI